MKERIEALSPEFWKWVSEHMEKPSAVCAVEARKMMDGDAARQALVQVEARRKALRAGKLRKLLETCPHFLFPSTLLAEQCSAEVLAQFNAGRAALGPEAKVVDLTFGLGIDAFAFAERGAKVMGLELLEDAVEAGRSNAAMMGLAVEVLHKDAVEWLREAAEGGFTCDAIFIDPARRNSAGARVYALEDCSPDIREVEPPAAVVAGQMLVKASPMTDIDAVMRRWPAVDHLWCVGLNGECKELLLRFNFADKPAVRTVSTIELNGDGSFTELKEEWPRAAEKGAPTADFISEGMWLHLPTAAMAKSMPQSAIAKRWPDLALLTGHRALYLSNQKQKDWPGRVLQVAHIYQSLKQAGKVLKGQKANTAVFDYPLSADALRAKTNLKPLADDSRFLIALTLANKKLLLWCEKN